MSLLKIIKEITKTRKSTAIVYFSLRFLVIVCMILQLMRGDLYNAFLCIFSLLLFAIPFFIQNKFKITLPNTLEIIIFLFIFSSEILGEINNFYKLIPCWDTILHIINGFLCAAIGFSLIDLLDKNRKKIKLSPIYLAIFSFCFSMTIGVFWEFFEFSADKIFLTDMQKDTFITKISTVELDQNKSNKSIILNDIGKTIIYDTTGNELLTIHDSYLDIGLHDTMKDLFVNLIGALAFSFLGYCYLLNKKKYKFASNFIPIKKIDYKKDNNISQNENNEQ